MTGRFVLSLPLEGRVCEFLGPIRSYLVGLALTCFDLKIGQIFTIFDIFKARIELWVLFNAKLLLCGFILKNSREIQLGTFYVISQKN